MTEARDLIPSEVDILGELPEPLEETDNLQELPKPRRFHPLTTLRERIEHSSIYNTLIVGAAIGGAVGIVVSELLDLRGGLEMWKPTELDLLRVYGFMITGSLVVAGVRSLVKRH